MTVTRKDPSDEGHIEALIFHEEDLPYIGVHTPYTVLLCCDREVYAAQACTHEQLGYTALTSAVAHHTDIYYKLVYFGKGQSKASLVHTYEVQKTGLHYVIFVNCAEKGGPSATLQGSLTWLNPDGFLSGSQGRLIAYFFVLGAVYAVTIALWIALLHRRRHQIILLHHALTTLLVLGALSTFAHAIVLFAENQTGHSCVPCAVSWAVLETMFSLALRGMALILALGLSIVCHWWDVERRQRVGLLVLTFAYVAAVGGQNLLIAISSLSDSSGRAPIFLMLPVNLVNTAFLITIFVELIRTIHMCRDDGEREKFKTYVKHLIFFFSVAAAALLFYIVQLLVQWRDVADLTWSFDWLFQATWDTAMFCIICVFVAFWFPSSNVKDMAFQELPPLEWRPQRRLID